MYFFFKHQNSNTSENRLKGWEEVKKWIREERDALRIVSESEIIWRSISLLSSKTLEEEEEEEDDRGDGTIQFESADNSLNGSTMTENNKSIYISEDVNGSPRGGVSVREKVEILKIVLEVMEGGGWIADYSELKEVVGRLEDEGKEGRRGKEWKEMG